MASRHEWADLQRASEYEFRRSGGCYWPSIDYRFGNSFRVPNGTELRIRLEGPESNRFVSGKCLNASWLSEDGSRFSSANQLVKHIRSDLTDSSNAFLYVLFEIDGSWIDARDARKDPALSIPQEEDQACHEAQKMALEQIKKKIGKDGERLAKLKERGEDNVAADAVYKNPQILEAAREIVRARNRLINMPENNPDSTATKKNPH